MVVLSKLDSSQIKSSSLPDANNRCTTISPPPNIRTSSDRPPLGGPAAIPADILTGDKVATSFIGKVRKITKIDVLPDALIDKLIADLYRYRGDYDAVLARVQKETRELAAERYDDDVSRAATFMSGKAWKAMDPNIGDDNAALSNRSVQTVRAYLNGIQDAATFTLHWRNLAALAVTAKIVPQVT